MSDSNLLLAREQPTTFSAPTIRRVRVQGCEVEVNLVRRKSHEPKGVFGLIHDLDMAALVSVQSVSSPPLGGAILIFLPFV